MRFIEKMKRKNLRIMEAHDALSALIVSQSKVNHEDDSFREFDGLWISSLCDSVVRGRPDMEVVTVTDRMDMVREIMSVTNKDIVFDVDSGGTLAQLAYLSKSLSREGISAIVIEDKIGVKYNSLFGLENPQKQDSIDHFCKKIKMALNNRVDNNMAVIARIESLTLGFSSSEVIERAEAYISAGAEGLLIHCVVPDTTELFKSIHLIKKMHQNIPIVVVPTAYPNVTETELFDNGVDMVIYANQLMRSIIKPMEHIAENILLEGCTLGIEKDLVSVKEILSFIPEVEI